MSPLSLPIARDWFAHRRLPGDIVVLDEPHVHSLLRANFYLVGGAECDLLVDTGNGIGDLGATLKALRRSPGKPLVAVLTHAHCDHQGGSHQCAERAVHPLEAGELANPSIVHPLRASEWPPVIRRWLAASGLAPTGVLVTAVPDAGFDPRAFRVAGCTPTRLLDEGDTVDLGDRLFRVLHLPGHSPGGIGLYEEKTGLLFSGDVVYDGGGLLDDIPGADRDEYARTMRRLRDLPVSTVHAGHEASFDRARLVEIAADYLASRGYA